MNGSSVPAPLANSSLEMLGSSILTLVLPLVYLLVFVFSMPCNLISLWLLCLHTKRKNPFVIFTINLCFTDLLYSVFLPFQVAYHFRGNDWPFGSVMCSMITIIFYANMHCSILTTCTISLHRYCGIMYPVTTRRWCTDRNSDRNSALVCLLIWACVLAVHLPLLHSTLVFRVDQLNVTTCFDILPKPLFPWKALEYVYFGTTLLFTVIAFFLLIRCYVAIVRKRRLLQVKKHLARLIVVVVLCFVCSYLPTTVLHLLRYYKLSQALNSLNCCFYPFIYYFASEKFRQNFSRKILCFAGARAKTVTSNPRNASKGVSNHTVAMLNK